MSIDLKETLRDERLLRGLAVLDLLALLALSLLLPLASQAAPPVSAPLVPIIVRQQQLREASARAANHREPAPQKEESRIFHPLAVDRLAVSVPGAAVPTHAEVSGRVEYRRYEEDGDVHLKVCGPAGGCVIVECIPELPAVAAQCRRFRKGSRVTVRGITRCDGKHRWWEIHPALAVAGAPQ